MVRLSVNINKVATLRNARGGNVPDLLQVAVDCERFGAQGITVHPRPDERHIRYADVVALKPLVQTEFNIEGYPSGSFIELVLSVKPDQVTLVPDSPDVLTSNAGWDVPKHAAMLNDVLKVFKNAGVRTSLFMDAQTGDFKAAADAGADRVELYTESYAVNFKFNKEKAVEPFVKAAAEAVRHGLGINAGHDLNLDNLAFFAKNVIGLQEVSIGHALISDALYFGLENTIQLYLKKLIPNG